MLYPQCLCCPQPPSSPLEFPVLPSVPLSLPQPHHHPESLSPLLSSSVPLTSIRAPLPLSSAPPGTFSIPWCLCHLLSPGHRPQHSCHLLQPPSSPSRVPVSPVPLSPHCLTPLSSPSAPVTFCNPVPSASQWLFSAPLSPSQCQHLHYASCTVTQRRSPTSLFGLTNTISSPLRLPSHPASATPFIFLWPHSSPIFSILILAEVPHLFSNYSPPALRLILLKLPYLSNSALSWGWAPPFTKLPPSLGCP